MSVVTIKAKKRFTTALADGTIVHFNPKIKELPTSRENVLVTDALRMHDRGWIDDFKNPDTGEWVREGQDAGVPGRRVAGAPEIAPEGSEEEPKGPVVTNAPQGEAPIAPAGIAESTAYTSKHVGGGWWQTLGPDGQPVGEKVKDKDAVYAETQRLNTLNAGPLPGVKQHPVGPTAGADTEHGNGEAEPGETTDLTREENGGGGNPDEAPAS